MGADPTLRQATRDWFDRACDYRYSYNFKWLGRPIIQFPQDIVAMQELVWTIKPRVIVETGIAHGGSLILSASLLQLLGGDGEVIGIDIDIREHNRKEIESHPLANRIRMIQGSSIDAGIVGKVREMVGDRGPVMVILDSNHTHDHVAKELELYSSMVTKGSYLLVFDTVVQFMKDDAFPDRPWSVGNNPYTAVQDFLKTNSRFQLDREIEDKLLITVAPGGWLKCIGD
jgi:cephalosporin hydroxylase